MQGSTNFIIADNQYLTHIGMRSIVKNTIHGVHIKDSFSKKELVSLMQAEDRGVVIIDYTNMDFTGIDNFLILHKRFPDYCWVLCSAELSDDFVRRTGIEENIGVVFKDCESGEIVKALEAAAYGGRYLCQQAAAQISSEQGRKGIEDVLTPTEIEILKLVARGKSAKEIAAERVSSTHTIITHKKNIFRKLGVNNVYEATKYALRAGLLEMMEYYI
ncbi:MAG: response regulator transcription factor [Muribaculaceae bacterium]|nr:response regulator transcription factor [Muribaculaceae bacterium]MDE7109268.1 response regulator transcription factor [Muribaculaceae bacterium]